MWTLRLGGAPRRENHAAVAVDDKVYSFGGYGLENHYNRHPIDIQVLDTNTLCWRPLRAKSQPWDVPYQRYGHTVVAYGKLIVLWGGRDEFSADNILYCFDTRTETWSRPEAGGHVPRPREGHSACVIGRRMYIFGGLEGDLFCQDVHFLDLDSMQWQHVLTAGKSPRWRGYHSASAIGDKMYVWGGRSDAHGQFYTRNEVYCKRLVYLDTTTYSWVYPLTNGSVPVGRRCHSSFVHNDELFIFGGFNGLLGAHFRSVHRYSPPTSEWSLLKTQGTGPCARSSQCCCMVGDRLFVFGGTSPVMRARQLQQDINEWLLQQDVNDAHQQNFNEAQQQQHNGNELQLQQDPNDGQPQLHGNNGQQQQHVNESERQQDEDNGQQRENINSEQQQQEQNGNDGPQLQHVVQVFNPFRLKDHSEMFVLDFAPSLKTLCIVAVTERGLDISNLPQEIKKDLRNITAKNSPK